MAEAEAFVPKVMESDTFDIKGTAVIFQSVEIIETIASYYEL